MIKSHRASVRKALTKHSRVSRILCSRETGVLAAKRRTAVTFALAFYLLAFEKRQQSQGSGGSWSRSAKMSSLGFALGLRVSKA